MKALILAMLAAGGELPATMDPAAIPNYQLLRPGLAVAGKPSALALAKLKEQGFKTVIDLRSENEGLAEEKASVESQGLRYVSVPMTAQSFSLADALKVKGVLEDPGLGARAPALRVLEPRGRCRRRDRGEERQERRAGARRRQEGRPAQRLDGRGRQARAGRARAEALSPRAARARWSSRGAFSFLNPRASFCAQGVRNFAR